MKKIPRLSLKNSPLLTMSSPRRQSAWQQFVSANWNSAPGTSLADKIPWLSAQYRGGGGNGAGAGGRATARKSRSKELQYGGVTCAGHSPPCPKNCSVIQRRTKKGVKAHCRASPKKAKNLSAGQEALGRLGSLFRTGFRTDANLYAASTHPLM